MSRGRDDLITLRSFLTTLHHNQLAADRMGNEREGGKPLPLPHPFLPGRERQRMGLTFLQPDAGYRHISLDSSRLFWSPVITCFIIITNYCITTVLHISWLSPYSTSHRPPTSNRNKRSPYLTHSLTISSNTITPQTRKVSNNCSALIEVSYVTLIHPPRAEGSGMATLPFSHPKPAAKPKA